MTAEVVVKPIALKNLRPCDLCGSPVAGNTRDGRAIDFRRLIIERHFLEMSALREHAGLTLMLGSEQVALVMGSQPNGTKPMSATEIVICNPCWYPLDGLVNALEGRKGRELEVPQEVRG